MFCSRLHPDPLKEHARPPDTLAGLRGYKRGMSGKNKGSGKGKKGKGK